MTEHTGTIQATHTLGSAPPGGDSIPVPSSPGNPRSRWYVKHKPETTATEAARKSAGLYGVQIRRLRKFAAGEPLGIGDVNLCERGFLSFTKSIASKIDWLGFVRVGDKWTVNDLGRLRKFLGMEE
jgi:hypothetical protein